MTINEGMWDRTIRIVAGIALIYAARLTWSDSLMASPAVVSIVYLTIGLIALFTGFVGWCPMYSLFDVSTNKRVGA